MLCTWAQGSGEGGSFLTVGTGQFICNMNKEKGSQGACAKAPCGSKAASQGQVERPESRADVSRNQQLYVNDASARASRGQGLFQGRKLKAGVGGGTGTHNLGTLLKFPKCPVVPRGPQNAQTPIYRLCWTRAICSAARWMHVQIPTSPLQLCGHRKGRRPLWASDAYLTRKSIASFAWLGSDCKRSPE